MAMLNRSGAAEQSCLTPIMTGNHTDSIQTQNNIAFSQAVESAEEGDNSFGYTGRPQNLS